MRNVESWLAALRVYTGFFWLAHGIPKILSGAFTGPDGQMIHFLRNAVANSVGGYHQFLVSVVLPHATTFALLCEWGEVLAGISLLLGFFTRLGGIGATFLALNYWAANGSFTDPGAYASFDILAAVLSVLHAILPTGRVFGVDGLVTIRRR
ncbi:MAG TPA: TQO small subunit DoxD [Candidatus Baltobacteraceae bacterium]|jgi:uncharacterized membrane protein YphA (DoxX/SURF4 family)|nr:TQO small subunit DoxD [Candidatus Baltobacteraceae bacterium]